MAFVVVTSLLEIVEQQLIIQPNPSLILYNKEMIVMLSQKLRVLRAFLMGSGKKTNGSCGEEMLEAEIRDAATEAEGEIESKLGQVYLAANRGEDVVVACQGLHQTLVQVVRDFEAIESRILTQNANNASRGSSTNDFREESFMVGGLSENAVETENEIVVGFDHDVEEIVYRLVFLKQSGKREVIALVGEGGIGKTTLAKIIFEHPSVIDHFHIRAWVVVSREHNLKEMLISLLNCIAPITSEISNKDEAQLAEQLCKRLMSQRYLIVLDNVWTTTAWHAIQQCFPHNANGSRIMITTRINNVARDINSHLHIMKYQSLRNSQELLSRKAFRGRFYSTPIYEYFRDRILLQCRGLPLAILVMGGLLATAKGSLEVWREVADTVELMTRDDKIISRILSLGFEYLPSHLKACFLYFGIFPEDSDVPAKKIINLWGAEGILKQEKNKSLEEGAENCLLDLINRNLVQVNKLSIDGRIKSCKIHDRLHEICVREAKRENIMCVIDEKHDPQASRWISCQSSHWPITRACCGTHNCNKIHSIFYFGKYLYPSKCRLVYPCLKLLRVLDLSLIKCLHGMPSEIVDLIHLKYLALSTIGSLYKLQLLKLQNLQTFIVSSWMEDYPLQLQCNILDLPQLKHLRLEKRCSQYLPSLVRENLQTLYWLKVTSLDRNQNFRMVPNLKELGIYIEGELLSGCVESLVHLRLLEKLKIEIGRVEQFYLPTAFPSKLKKLTLHSTYLPWHEMGIIGKLPNLEVLKLKDFAFCGPEWNPIGWEFQDLKVLLIAHTNLKRWNANFQHFPVLERLILRYCWDLKKVPIGFAKIRTLKLIELDSCYSSIVTSANQISSAKILSFHSMSDRTLHVRHFGTKVEWPNNESSEEES
ncbi:putative late blight resistance protein homolog R1B-14 [Ipomoea triloba]|uniref:putative late blight resistance protein homolog R1B-14 n=1 Tax=Ipomoea triloba TaxID=35885 RepID=UPI00125E0F1F|nr:putative late blight resistance protein homolog R1B-14 [Ipomoea triloba]